MLFKAIAVKERYKDPEGKVMGYKIRDYLKGTSINRSI